MTEHIDLVFDTETTGMVLFKDSVEHPGQPDLVQLAACLSQGDYILGEINFLVKPDMPIHEKAREAHGITDAILELGAVPRRIALAAFSQMARKATRLVAHNSDFDMKVIGANLFKESQPDIIRLINSKIVHCTMKNLTNVCKIPHPAYPGRFKWPTLQEAYRILVDPEGFEGAHNASVDVRACLAILRASEKIAT